MIEWRCKCFFMAKKCVADNNFVCVIDIVSIYFKNGMGGELTKGDQC